MNVLIRYSVRGTVREEVTVSGDQVTVGRAADRDLTIADQQLPLEHSAFVASGRNLQIKAAGDQVSVNGRAVSSAELRLGDRIELAGHAIVVEAADGDADHVLLVELGNLDDGGAGIGRSFATQLQDTGLSKRGSSWGLFAAIVLLCLIVPVAGVLMPPLGETLRATPVSDGQWDPGPLHQAHRFMDDDCSACHGVPFQKTPDEACVTCHHFVEHHVDATVHHIPEFDEGRCATCHEEHHEPETLVRRDQAHCTSCHGDLPASTDGAVDLQNATDFEFDHPELKVSMFTPDGRGYATTWHVERVALDSPDLSERSNLKFPHDIHVAPGGIDSPTGNRVLDCRDCHRLESGGQYVEPVSMEANCSECHRLTFDPQDPTREVPHGDAVAVVEMLNEYYALQILQSSGSVAPVTTARAPRARRRRGESLEAPPVARPAPAVVAASATVETGVVMTSARGRAMEAARNIFENTTCTVCHEVTQVDGGAEGIPWQVDPVRLTRIWMPKSWFDHAAHATEECTYCHDTVTVSDVSADVNMPGIGICRDCHGGEHSTGLLESTCIDCHRFHVPGLEVMKPDVEGAVTRDVASRIMPIRDLRADLPKDLRTNEGSTSASDGAEPGGAR